MKDANKELQNKSEIVEIMPFEHEVKDVNLLEMCGLFRPAKQLFFRQIMKRKSLKNRACFLNVRNMEFCAVFGLKRNFVCSTRQQKARSI